MQRALSELLRGVVLSRVYAGFSLTMREPRRWHARGEGRKCSAFREWIASPPVRAFISVIISLSASAPVLWRESGLCIRGHSKNVVVAMYVNFCYTFN